MYLTACFFVSAQFVRIATNDMLVITNGMVFVSAHRVQIATQQVDQLLFLGNLCLSAPRADRNFAKSTCASIHSRYFVSAHRVQIATANVHKAPRADLWNAL